MKTLIISAVIAVSMLILTVQLDQAVRCVGAKAAYISLVLDHETDLSEMLERTEQAMDNLHGCRS